MLIFGAPEVVICPGFGLNSGLQSGLSLQALAFSFFGKQRDDEQVDAGEPHEEQDDGGWEEDPQLDVVMEPGAVVDGFDEVAAAISHLQDFGAGGVDLKFPAIIAADFEHAPVGSDVQAIDVIPVLDCGFRD